MTFNMNSVIKAGGIGAAIALLLALLGAIPLLNCLLMPLLCLAWFALPVTTGMLYGYFTPGKETLGESALGGALSGGFAGFVYAVINGVVGAATGGVAAAFQQLEGIEGMPMEATSFGLGSLLVAVCISVFAGLLFGAIGGVLWPMFQGNRGR
ncbi:MAG: hypothetical protein RRC07_01735 [Anaerolineae bacterium]|nr:hypothetical protein [Anaerolineae bacterium]